jgi:hypothetical protein
MCGKKISHSIDQERDCRSDFCWRRQPPSTSARSLDSCEATVLPISRLAAVILTALLMFPKHYVMHLNKSSDLCRICILFDSSRPSAFLSFYRRFAGFVSIVKRRKPKNNRESLCRRFDSVPATICKWLAVTIMRYQDDER